MTAQKDLVERVRDALSLVELSAGLALELSGTETLTDADGRDEGVAVAAVPLSLSPSRSTSATTMPTSAMTTTTAVIATNAATGLDSVRLGAAGAGRPDS